ncbi:hypothetical protein, partial [Mesorhizobium sp.]|uniref:hypothetical protein n=3 Tax=Mesorhizobium sp. TaxID=1871066 RepID=UPI0025DF121D
QAPLRPGFAGPPLPTSWGEEQVPPQLPKSQNIAIYAAMEKLFSDPAYKGFVLQDRKRLPSRFSARVCGALTSRLN